MSVVVPVEISRRYYFQCDLHSNHKDLTAYYKQSTFKYVMSFIHLFIFAHFQVTAFSCSKIKDDKEDGFFYFRYSST